MVLTRPSVLVPWGYEWHEEPGFPGAATPPVGPKQRVGLSWPIGRYGAKLSCQNVLRFTAQLDSTRTGSVLALVGAFPLGRAKVAYPSDSFKAVMPQGTPHPKYAIFRGPLTILVRASYGRFGSILL